MFYEKLNHFFYQ